MRTDGQGSSFTVGYLDAAHPFPTGAVPDEFVGRLISICERTPILTLGFHTCELCGNARNAGDLIVAGADGRVYVAPTMIAHYVVDHGYCPPAEFVEAVLGTPLWEGHPLLLPEQTLNTRRCKHPWDRLPLRYVALRFKRHRILADPRWWEQRADTLLADIDVNAKFGSPGDAELMALISDPRYDLAAQPARTPQPAERPAPRAPRPPATPREAALDKRPELLQDPRWHEPLADERLMDLEEQMFMGRRSAVAMVELLNDPQYDLPAGR